MEEKIQRVVKPKSILKKDELKSKKSTDAGDNDEEDEEDEEESDIALSDLDDMPDSDREDLFVKTKLSINNGPALLASVKRISIPRDASVPFVTHQTVVSSEPTAAKIEDISDDLGRELQLYAQSLEAAKKARSLLRAEGFPFSRPKDYFAEMVKDDGHMEKVKAKMIEEASAKKASAEARKLRDLKKFGKQVQVAKLQERQKQKRETLEKIKSLKKSMFFFPPGASKTKSTQTHPLFSSLYEVQCADMLLMGQSVPRTGTTSPTKPTSSTLASTTNSTSPASARGTATRADGRLAPSAQRRTPSTALAGRRGTPSPGTRSAPVT